METIFCPECGNQLPAGSKFCSECGHKFEPQQNTCQACGAKLDANVRFCPVCGTQQASEPPRVESQNPYGTPEPDVSHRVVRNGEEYIERPDGTLRKNGDDTVYVPAEKYFAQNGKRPQNGPANEQQPLWDPNQGAVNTPPQQPPTWNPQQQGQAPQQPPTWNPQQPVNEQQPLWDPNQGAVNSPPQQPPTWNPQQQGQAPQQPPTWNPQQPSMNGQDGYNNPNGGGFTGAFGFPTSGGPIPQQPSNWGDQAPVPPAYGETPVAEPPKVDPLSYLVDKKTGGIANPDGTVTQNGELSEFNQVVNGDGYYDDRHPLDEDEFFDEKRKIQWVPMILGIVGIIMFAVIALQLNNFIGG